jgi:hypothetical protein
MSCIGSIYLPGLFFKVYLCKLLNSYLFFLQKIDFLNLFNKLIFFLKASSNSSNCDRWAAAIAWIRYVPHRRPRLYECCVTTGQESVSWRNLCRLTINNALCIKTEPMQYKIRKSIKTKSKSVKWKDGCEAYGQNHVKQKKMIKYIYR